MDLNSDGHFDILSGSYSRDGADMAGLFQVLWGQPGGTFKKAAALNGTDGQPLVIPVKGKAGEGEDWIKNICTRPFAVDWDGDGDLDLVVGNFFGTFYLFTGEGKGKFAPVPEEMKAGDQPLKIEGHHSDPFVIDWDRDGDLDLLSGSSEGGVAWSENRAGPGRVPQLAAFQSLIKGAGHVDEYGKVVREDDLKGPASATRVWADDVNGDGKLDLLVGDLTTLISPAPNLTEQQFKEKFDEWNQSVSKASAEINATDKDEKARNEAIQKLQKLYSQRSQFMKEESTGFVWLYLQK